MQGLGITRCALNIFLFSAITLIFYWLSNIKRISEYLGVNLELYFLTADFQFPKLLYGSTSNISSPCI